MGEAGINYEHSIYCKSKYSIHCGKQFSNNVLFGGYIPNAKVPEALNEQDILLLPNQRQQVCKNEDIGMVASPLKMFEYMASGRKQIKRWRM